MPGRRLLIGAALLTALVAATSGCGRGYGPSQHTTSAPPPTTSKPASPSPTKPQGFRSQIKKVTAGDLRYSWRRGCPVSPSGLRMIEMTYWGMDRKPHTNGRLVVSATVADDVTRVFRKLYNMRYPIERIEPVDAYKGSDFDSIEANNTSAFNCRPATGSSSWSEHAFGKAIDINPCQNPYVSADGRIAHKHCVKFGNRKRKDPGVIHANDRVVKAFASIGWGWGGEWQGAKDYQHFSAGGR